jgi:hypothetical protein
MPDFSKTKIFKVCKSAGKVIASELSDAERVILVEFMPQCNKPTENNTLTQRQ